MKQETLGILIIDNNQQDVSQLVERLQSVYTVPLLDIVDSVEPAFELLSKQRYDFIVVDPAMMPDDPQNLVTQLVALAPDIPLLAYSANENADLAHAIVQQGAQDYLVKGRGNALTLKRIIDYSIERQRAAERVQQNETMLKTFIKYAPAGIAVFDRDMRLLMASDRWKKGLKLPIDGPEDQKLSELMAKGTRKWRESVEHVLNGELIKCDDDVLEHSDGSIDYMKWEMMPWYNREGEIAGIIKFSEIITEQRTLQMELEASQATLEQKVEERTAELQAAMHQLEEAEAAKAEFFTNITHELRTPLHAIINFSNFGVRKIDKVDKEKLVQYFSDIQSSGERLLGLVNDILDLSKYQSNTASMFEFREQEILPTLETAAKEMGSLLGKHNMELVIKNNATSQQACFDRNRLMQVLVNLVSNAIKFSPDNTKITIAYDDSTEALAKKEGLEGVLLSISDEGPGIPDSELNTIFDEFVQSSKVQHGKFSQGTGIGLAVCRQLVRAHGGQIWAENNTDIGATIYFTLPRSMGDIPQNASEEK